MSQLTDEQRKRIEENRRKALEKRARAASQNTLPRSVNNVPPKLQNSASAFLPFLKTPATNAIAPKIEPISSELKKDPIHPWDSNPLNNSPKPYKPKEYVRGTCVLLSRTRFCVEVSFHKELIDLFKTIPSRLYDMQTRMWNFSIKDHDLLLSTVKPLQPDVMVIPLPSLVLNVFKYAPEKRFIKQHDLSVLDPVMLQSLLPFQKDGVNFAIQRDGRVLIADDMGLGKTIQAIAIANFYSKDWPLLIVTPSSVRYSWEEALHTWLPSLDRHEISIINSGKDHVPNNKVILISYDLLSKMLPSLQNRKFKSAIFDESHFLKNPKTARTKAALEILKDVKRAILLTGTPALSRPIELYTQLSSLRRRKFFSYMEYGLRYCDGMKNQWGYDFSGSSKMEELQLFLEEEIMIRRLKSDVIKQLPPKFRQMIVLDPTQVHNRSKAMMSMSQNLKQKDLGSMERRGILLEYFHETGKVKLKAVCEYIFDLLESDRKFLCFAHHQVMLNGICKAVEAQQVRYIRIDGSVSSEQRKKLCDEFQQNDNCQVAVLSITAANCGITLTAGSLVVFAELFWNPGILIQAEDRAHRIGQENSVVVQYLVAKGTSDDEIWPLVQRKLETLNKAGLSKDSFKSAETIFREDTTQLHMEDFWAELNESLENIQDCNDFSEKRPKLEF